jgi:hypothetical protein
MTGRVLPVKHSVSQPIHRPCPRPIRANQRSIHRHKYPLIPLPSFFHEFQQLSIPMRIAKSQHLSLIPLELQKADAIVHFVSPGQIHADE